MRYIDNALLATHINYRLMVRQIGELPLKDGERMKLVAELDIVITKLVNAKTLMATAREMVVRLKVDDILCDLLNVDLAELKIQRDNPQ